MMKAMYSVCEFTWLWSPKDYWYALVSALVGAGIGIWWTIKHFERQELQQRKRCLASLKRCIEFNLERLKQSQEQLEKNVVPNYCFDTSQFNYWITQSHGTVSADLLRKIDWQRFQLDHISAKFMAVNAALLASGGTLKVDAIPLLGEHIGKVMEELATLLGELPPAE